MDLKGKVSLCASSSKGDERTLRLLSLPFPAASFIDQTRVLNVIKITTGLDALGPSSGFLEITCEKMGFLVNKFSTEQI